MPTRIEQAFIMTLASIVLASAVGSVLYQSTRQAGVRDVADPSARRTIVFTVDINSATSPELLLLPTVGPITAQRIVNYRETNGRFSAVEDVLLVKGIGPKKFAAMAPYLIVGSRNGQPPSAPPGDTAENESRATKDQGDHDRPESLDAQL